MRAIEKANGCKAESSISTPPKACKTSMIAALEWVIYHVLFVRYPIFRDFMLKIRIVLVGCILLAWSTFAYGAEPDAGPVYRKAMGIASKWEKDYDRLKQWDEIPLDEARKLAAQGKDALELLSQATKLKECDWQVDTRGPQEVNMSFLYGAKLLCMMAGLQSRMDFEDGKKAAAMDRLLEDVVMGQRLRQIPIAVARLMGGACEMSAIEAAATYLPNVDAATADKMTKWSIDVPKMPTVDEVGEAEDRVTPNAKTPAAQDQLRKMLKDVRLHDQRVEVIRAMFQAALIQHIKGDAAMKAVKDPAGDGPFTIRKWEGGYELSSKATWKDKPVTLVVGKEEKPK